MAEQQMESWDTAHSNYILQLERYRTWFGILVSEYFSSCSGKVTLDGLIGAVVSRARSDADNLRQWIDEPISLVAYCTRSLLELSTMMWSIDRNRDLGRWYGFMVRDLIEVVRKVTGTSASEKTEMAKVLDDISVEYCAAGIAIPEHHENSKDEAQGAGYLKEYDEVNQLLSKYIHPTPLTLIGPEQLVDSVIVRRYFLMKSMKYLRTIYCLAAKQSGYNPAGAEVDVTRQLAILRADLDPEVNPSSSKGGRRI